MSGDEARAKIQMTKYKTQDEGILIGCSVSMFVI
jgi:hypothetical protein